MSHYVTQKDFLKPFFFFFGLFMSVILYYQYGQETKKDYTTEDWIAFKQIAVADPKSSDETPTIVVDGVVKKDFDGTLQFQAQKITDTEVVVVCQSDEKTVKFVPTDPTKYNTMALNWSEFFHNCNLEKGNQYRVIGTLKIPTDDTVLVVKAASNIFTGVPQ